MRIVAHPVCKFILTRERIKKFQLEIFVVFEYSQVKYSKLYVSQYHERDKPFVFSLGIKNWFYLFSYTEKTVLLKYLKIWY